MFRYDEIQARLRQQPFRPVRIIVSEGLKYDIHHPDLVMVGFRDMVLGLPHTDHPAAYDRIIRIALAHVVGMEDLPVTAGATNGMA